jgi:hypothetical protein
MTATFPLAAIPHFPGYSSVSFMVYSILDMQFFSYDPIREVLYSMSDKFLGNYTFL